MNVDRGTRLLPLLLLIVCALFFFLQLGTLGLWDPDETRYAEIGREMADGGDYVVPHLNNLPYLDKPPFYYWTVATSFRLFGAGEFTARLPNALAATIGVFALFALGKKLFNDKIGFWGACVLATSFLYVALARVVLTDVVLTCMIILAFASFYSAYAAEGKRRLQKFLGSAKIKTKNEKLWMGLCPIPRLSEESSIPNKPDSQHASGGELLRRLPLFGMYIFCGLAFLTKGPVGLIIPFVAIFLFLWIQRDLGYLRRMELLYGATIIALIIAPWYYLVSLRQPTFLYYFFIEQNLLGFFTGNVHHPYPFYMSIPMVLGAFMPWSIFLLCLLPLIPYRNALERLRGDPQVCFLFCWVAVAFGLFTVSQSKLLTYFLPTIPPLALLTVMGWERLVASAPESRVRKAHLVGAVGVISLGLVGVALAVNSPYMKTIVSRNDSLTLVMAGVALLTFAIFWTASFILIAKKRWRAGAGGLIAAYGLLLTLLIPIVKSTEEVRCPKKVITDAEAFMTKEDKIVSFHNHAAGFGFYAQRPFLIVGKEREYGPGLRLAADPGNYSLSEMQLYGLIFSKERIFVYFSKDDVNRIPADVRERLRPVAEDAFRIVMVNDAL